MGSAQGPTLRPTLRPTQGPTHGLAEGATPRRHGDLTRLRAILIGWVILYHLDLLLDVGGDRPWTAPLLHRGYLGVDGFFLLSGFALWLGYGARPPGDWAAAKLFWRRRFARTWPLHALVLLVLGALVGGVTLAGVAIRDPGRFGLTEYALQLTLLHGWETTDRHAWNSPSWALSVEWAGYLAFPLLVQALRRLPLALLPGVVGLAVGGLWWLAWDMAGLNLTLHLGLARFGLEFVLGLALGRLATAGWLAGAGLAWVAALGLSAGLLIGADALVVLGLAALLPALWQRPGSGIETGLLHRLGEASFGIYICWVFVEVGMVALLRFAQPGPGEKLLLLAGGLGAACMLGSVAFRWAELPLQRWVLGVVRPPAATRRITQLEARPTR